MPPKRGAGMAVWTLRAEKIVYAYQHAAGKLTPPGRRVG